jgi:hypothetical protein
MSALFRLLATALVKTGRLIVWFYYSPVRIIGRHQIPPSGPVLLVANHANSLIDPVLVGLAARRRVFFLAKAPLFQVPLFGNRSRQRQRRPASARPDVAQHPAGLWFDPGAVRGHSKRPAAGRGAPHRPVSATNRRHHHRPLAARDGTAAIPRLV